MKRLGKDVEVFEIGEPGHIGTVVRIHKKRVLVHWAPGCTRWHNRSSLGIVVRRWSLNWIR